jgi:DNA-binding MarR family transcriptional regulator
MPAACPSGDERVTLFGLLLETNARLVKAVNAGLERDCDMSLPWMEALLALRRTPEGRLRMTELAELVVLSNGGATRLVDRLEELQFVERVHCPTDRRAIHVAITPSGNARLDEALAVHVAQLDAYVGSQLTPAERKTLTALLTKLQAGV